MLSLAWATALAEKKCASSRTSAAAACARAPKLSSPSSKVAVKTRQEFVLNMTRLTGTLKGCWNVGARHMPEIRAALPFIGAKGTIRLLATGRHFFCSVFCSYHSRSFCPRVWRQYDAFHQQVAADRSRFEAGERRCGHSQRIEEQIQVRRATRPMASFYAAAAWILLFV